MRFPDRFLVATALVAALTAGSAHAATRNVPGTYPTIQAAVNAANPGDVIAVAPGVYLENVITTKSLVFQGANAGLDARSPRGPESIVDGHGFSACIQLKASNCVVDGFTLRAGQDNGVNAGVWMDVTKSGNQVLNDILTDNVMGVFAQCSGATLIRHNVFDGNNRSGPNNGTGVYAEKSTNLTIEENEFRNHVNHAARFASSPSPSHANLVFSCNSVHDNGNGVLAIGVSGGAFDRNDCVANTLTALSLGGGCTNVTLDDNRVTGGFRGVRVSDSGFGAGDNGNITVRDNALAGSSQFGLGVLSACLGTVDARGNWWGAASGPGGDGPGTGDAVIVGAGMSVDFSAHRHNGTDADPAQCGFQPLAGGVTPIPPDTTLCPLHPCLTVPVVLDRFDPASLRGYSVTLQLANLALCGPGITEDDLLSSIGGTQFQVVNNGGGSYTVDGAILGLPCGAPGGGAMFDLHVAGTSPTGPGTITVTAVTLRDCNNLPIPGTPGPPASLPINNVTPPQVTGLAATQVKSGNLPPDGRTAIRLNFTAPGAPLTVEVWRAPFGHYPEYDDAGGAAPAVPSYPPGAPWTLTAVTADGQTDKPPTRDFWYYVAFCRDSCDNVSTSARTPGTLDYHLGDVTNGVTPGQGNDVVTGVDISLLGANYGIGETDITTRGVEYLDVGPTTNFTTDGRPTTDDLINFEDLVMFAINFAPAVSAPSLASAPARAEAADALALEAPAHVTAGADFTVALRLRGAGDLQAISAQLGWDAAVVSPEGVVPGDFVASQGGVVLSPQPGGVDAALLGVRAAGGIAGEGVLATVRFHARASGDPGIVLARLLARDAANHPVELGATHAPVAPALPAHPAVTALLPAAPNPFHHTVQLGFSLAVAGPSELAIYAVDGRRVRTVAARAVREPGEYHVTWDGRDDGGRAVAPGIFFARLESGTARFTRAIVHVR